MNSRLSAHENAAISTLKHIPGAGFGVIPDNTDGRGGFVVAPLPTTTMTSTVARQAPSLSSIGEKRALAEIECVGPIATIRTFDDGPGIQDGVNSSALNTQVFTKRKSVMPQEQFSPFTTYFPDQPPYWQMFQGDISRSFDRPDNTRYT